MTTKLFELKETLRLYAENIDDAFRKIGKYYLALSRGEDVESIGIPGTDIKIRKVDIKS